ncbi:hypothetical protein B0T14DRAFT_565247 [Immersiella caudata]|uniref:Uncharacterized protein n=1 Tax=Immersiella caudata TaxID=314043 RepID=A0AA40C3R5_9PEZI|nr:hypothetical protein B0T14DRAFT_565247 [Immersiella caudata]
MESSTQRPPSPPASERSPELQASQEDSANMRSVVPHHQQKAPTTRHLVRKEPALDHQSLQAPATEQQVAQHDDGRGGAPAVRLDMDLDVDVQMKAKIQGDLTLSILGGDQRPTSDKGHSTKALEG